MALRWFWARALDAFTIPPDNRVAHPPNGGTCVTLVYPIWEGLNGVTGKIQGPESGQRQRRRRECRMGFRACCRQDHL